MLSVLNDRGRTIFVLDEDPRGAALVSASGDLNPTSRRIWNRLTALDTWSKIVDVGANYGEMILGGDLAPGAQAWAFEPSHRIAECLSRSVAEADLNVRVVEKAVAAEPGTISLFEDLKWSGTTTASADHQIAGAVATEVEVVRLDQFLMESGLGKADRLLVKIDVEGGELDVLRGLISVVPIVERLVIQAEIVHCSDEELRWMIKHFVLHAVSIDELQPFPIASLADLRRLAATGLFYPQDAVIATSVLTAI